MLGNQVELWETMLAAMKLGAVVIPATHPARPGRPAPTGSTAATCATWSSRAERRRRASSPTSPAAAPGSRSASAVDGWLRYARRPSALADVRAGRRRRTGRRPAAALLHLRHDRAAQARRAHPRLATRSATCPRCTGSACSPGDVHLNISSPGWAKHAWSNLFAPWNAEATVLHRQPRRGSTPPALLDAMDRCGATTLLRAADGVADARSRPTSTPLADVPLREVVGAGEPLNPEVIEQVRRAWGLTVRDGYGQTETTAQIGNPPGAAGQARLDGPAAARLRRRAARPGHRRGRRSEGEICLDLSTRGRSALMAGYRDDARQRTPRRSADGYYHTGDVAPPRRRRLHHLRRPDRRRVQGVGLPDLARSSWRAC